MASTGLMNGTLIVLSVSTDGSTYNTIGHATSSSISYALDTPDATSKDSGGYREIIAGVRSLDFSFDGFVAYDDTVDVDTLLGYIDGRTKIYCKFGTAVSGDTVYSCEGFLTSIEYSADSESPATYSGSFSSTGSVTTATNT